MSESGIATTTPALRSSGGLERTGEDAYPTDRSKPAPSAHSSAVRKNAPLADLTELFTATDATTLTKICELLEAAQPVPKKSHHSQKNADDTDVEMTDAGGGGDDKPISSRTCSPCTSPRSVRVHLVTIALET